MSTPDEDQLAELLAERAAGRETTGRFDPSIQAAVDAAVTIDRQLASLGLAYHGHPNAAGPWRLLRPLGRGTAGVVYAAEHAMSGERAALRTVVDPAESSLRQTAERLVGWRHNAIAGVIEVGPGWIASEFVEGTSLASILGQLTREPSLDHEESARPLLRAMAPVVDALRVARENEHVHGGIRPSKLELEEIGRFRLRDFGFDPSRAFRPPSAGAPPLGSPVHLAPEQAGGPGIVGPMTDLYSLCSVLYTIATGTPPFVARSLEELLRSIRTGIPRSPEDLARWLPREIQIRIMTGLSKRPDDRIVGLRRLIDRLIEL